MKVKLYSLRDEISQEFLGVDIMKNDRVAMRAFIKMMSEKDVNETEFGYYYLGDFDTEEGITEIVPPINLRDIVIDDVEMELFEKKEIS